MYQPNDTNRNNSLPALIKPLLIFGLGIGAVFVLLVAIAGNQIGQLVIAFAVFGALIVALAFMFSIILRVSSKPIETIGKVQLDMLKERNKNAKEMAELGLLPNDGRYIPSPVIMPKAIAAPQEAPLDPRHPLLVALCLMTVRSNLVDDKTKAIKYGPSSIRLMSADDAQAESKTGVSTFADRNNWDKASKYGQDIGLLFTKIGGQDQGLRITKLGEGHNTAGDLLSELMDRNTALKAGVNALPVA